MNLKLIHAYKVCVRVINEHSSSYYWTFSFLHDRKRNAIWAVYAYFRKVDDSVDETREHILLTLLAKANTWHKRRTAATGKGHLTW
ncbi:MULTISPECIES: squalene/phytoene synthase family protein [unclassified Paenibacillus]|uniref:squalene/phytoene synthase family protein n=1 Tax=unclassified Paenibacillus TaxID=185978 RepID=UPI001AE6DA2A|nr:MULTISPECIES: squalene/phytoene synthase family protein [unclassified Paenibacillus]MBP1155477.1 phytoene/squalene synthetase [Paenibacillus sp. PvP091]MBP1169137.1 phytoene/squalene synthetase [Paenibacillus sp. PvR098]MBP2440165.1 phytoene/squalene synthetase [Paenibacillus sp. PvP052]